MPHQHHHGATSTMEPLDLRPPAGRVVEVRRPGRQFRRRPGMLGNTVGGFFRYLQMWLILSLLVIVLAVVAAGAFFAGPAHSLPSFADWFHDKLDSITTTSTTTP